MGEYMGNQAPYSMRLGVANADNPFGVSRATSARSLLGHLDCNPDFLQWALFSGWPWAIQEGPSAPSVLIRSCLCQLVIAVSRSGLPGEWLPSTSSPWMSRLCRG